MATKRKYIDSHWLIFVVQGIITLLCGWYVMFLNSQDVVFLVSITGVMLLALSLVELFNILHRQHTQSSQGFTLFAAAIEFAVGLMFIFASTQNIVAYLMILAGYTLVRGVCELLLAIKSVDDRTDKFIWGVCGVCGVILSFVVLNSGNLAPGAFVKIFASYLVILGLGALIYGIHNRDQSLERKAARKKSIRKKTKKISARKK